ncbi:hypothetical protein OC65_23705 [Salmonella enterica]|nr:hypothetical protein [Salmonella enterica]
MGSVRRSSATRRIWYGLQEAAWCRRLKWNNTWRKDANPHQDRKDATRRHPARHRLIALRLSGLRRQRSIAISSSGERCCFRRSRITRI